MPLPECQYTNCCTKRKCVPKECQGYEESPYDLHSNPLGNRAVPVSSVDPSEAAVPESKSEFFLHRATIEESPCDKSARLILVFNTGPSAYQVLRRLRPVSAKQVAADLIWMADEILKNLVPGSQGGSENEKGNDNGQ